MEHPYQAEVTATAAGPLPAVNGESPPEVVAAVVVSPVPTEETAVARVGAAASTGIGDEKRLPSSSLGVVTAHEEASLHAVLEGPIADKAASHSTDVSSSSLSSSAPSPRSSTILSPTYHSHLSPSTSSFSTTTLDSCDDAAADDPEARTARHRHRNRPQPLQHRQHHHPHSCSTVYSSDANFDVQDEPHQGLPRGGVGRRRQVSELTRFTRVLAVGRAGDEGRAIGAVSTLPTIYPWWRSSDMAVTPCLSAAEDSVAQTNAVHPYQCLPNASESREDVPFNTSPSSWRPRGTAVELSDRAVSVPIASVFQSPWSITSPLLTTIASDVTPPPPLPPPHPRRSSSAQSRTSNTSSGRGGDSGSAGWSARVPCSHGGGGGLGAVSTALTPDRGTPSSSLRGTASSTAFGPPVPMRRSALQRSLSFTAGTPPVPAAGFGLHPFFMQLSQSPTGVIRGGNGGFVSASPGQLRPSSADRALERTPSVASSVHSMPSSVRRSALHPRSHVGTPSNLMAAVWVDLPPSLPGSRCATPLNGNSDAFHMQPRRRTTPRHSSAPASLANSTLAASVESSLEGLGDCSSTVEGCSQQRRRLRIIAGTQTDWDDVTAAAVEDSAATSLPRRLYAASSPVSPLAHGDDAPTNKDTAAHLYNVGAASAGTTPMAAMADSVSSTSAEWTPRSFQASSAEVPVSNGDADASKAETASRKPGLVAASQADCTVTTPSAAAKREVAHSPPPPQGSPSMGVALLVSAATIHDTAPLPPQTRPVTSMAAPARSSLTLDSSAAVSNAPTADVERAPGQIDEVVQLREALAEMRRQYAEAMQQLRRMQDAVATGGAGAPDAAQPPLPASSPPPFFSAAVQVQPPQAPPSEGASLPDCSLSSPQPPALTSHAAPRSTAPPQPRGECLEDVPTTMQSARNNEAATTSWSVSTNSDDISATLDHVREALQRTRQRKG